MLPVFSTICLVYRSDISFNTWDLDVTEHNTGAACLEQDDIFIDSGIPRFLIWRVLTYDYVYPLYPAHVRDTS